MILRIYGALIRCLTFLSTICVFPFNPQNKPCEAARLLALQMGGHTAGGLRGSSSGAVLLSTAELAREWTRISRRRQTHQSRARVRACRLTHLLALLGQVPSACRPGIISPRVLTLEVLGCHRTTGVGNKVPTLMEWLGLERLEGRRAE